jgi:hypothetical protein
VSRAKNTAIGEVTTKEGRREKEGMRKGREGRTGRTGRKGRGRDEERKGRRRTTNPN